jgi:hypothetical protein
VHGFDVFSSELTGVQDQLVEDFEDFLEKERVKRRKSAWGMRSNNFQIRPEIMFIFRVSAGRPNRIQKEVRDRFLLERV